MRGLQYDTNKFAASRWIAEKTSEFVVPVYGVGEKMVEIIVLFVLADLAYKPWLKVRLTSLG